MPLKINYLTTSNKLQSLIGKISFYNNYKEPSIEFPFFYLGQKQEVIHFSNWPDLVPYLYDKKLGYFTTIDGNYQFKTNFLITAFYINNNTITLTFTDKYALNALNALIEDRELYRIENGSYTNWNRTATFLTDILANNKIILNKNRNYKIENLMKLTEKQINMEIKLERTDNVNLQLLGSKELEFGLYRMENKTERESILYHGINSKYFITPREGEFFGGLKNRSQIIHHYHDHRHDMNGHTHTISHSHSLSNHSHDVSHTHSYAETVGNVVPVPYGPTYIYHTYHTETFWGNWSTLLGNSSGNDYLRWSLNTRELTDPPNVLETERPSNSVTSSPINISTNNSTSINTTRTTEKDNIFTNDNNFKIGNKNLYDSNVIYAYIYGGRYK